MAFRKDINGLRAVAVLAVVLFHFNPDLLRGGFAGVDVFFVISGYLMTSIIFKNISNGAFDLFGFYKARFRRIAPALVLLCVFLVGYGFFLMPPIPFFDLAKHSIGSILFVSNFIYWSESGYFDVSSMDKMLLHTWSLSVEWQFYVIYPIILLFLSKIIRLDKLKLFILSGTVIGFVFSIYASTKWPTSAYFLLPTRGWEMMAGGVAFLYPLFSEKRFKAFFSIAPLLLIVSSFFLVSSELPWPGYAALLPVAGAFLLLQQKGKDNFILNNFILQKIGLLSYSIYLVHWPILLILRKSNYDFSLIFYVFLIFLASLILFILTERKRVSITWSVASIVAGASLFFSILITNGMEFRVSPEFKLNKEDYHAKYYGGSGYASDGVPLFFNVKENGRYKIIIGDSYARQYSKFIDINNKKAIGLFMDGCLVTENYVASYAESNSKCINKYTDTVSTLNKYRNEPVILIQRWSGYFSQLQDKSGKVSDKSYVEVIEQELDFFLSNFQKSRKIFLVGEALDTIGYSVFECISKNALPIYGLFDPNGCKTTQELRDIGINQLLKNYANTRDGVHYIDPSNVLCRDNLCKLVTDDGKPIYSDGTHLSIYGADIVGNYIFNEVDRIEKIM